jgi:hypothetical protein
VVRLTAPNGGEVLYPGQVVPILWETHGTKRTVAEVRVYFTKDGERTWDPIGVVPDNPESYDNWTVPAVSRTRRKCKVKVVLVDERGLRLGADTSDAFCVIEP